MRPLLAILCLCLSVSCFGDPPKTVDSFDALQLAKLDAALANIRAIQAKAEADMAKYAQQVEEICQHPAHGQGFHAVELNNVVSVDYTTGVITDMRKTAAKPGATGDVKAKRP